MNEFILYRASGLTLREIAEKLNISTKTAERWNKKYKTEIEEMKADFLDRMKQQIEAENLDRVKEINNTIKKLDEILNTKDLSKVNTATLLDLKLKYLKELRQNEEVF